jgi:tRNA 2-thiouridine synthesizing protein C
VTEAQPTGPAASPPPARRVLCVNRRAPHGSVYALEALEVVLVGAAFDQAVTVLFIDDGVWQLKSGQDTAGIGVKDFSPTFRALEMYEVRRVVVEGESLARRGLEPKDLVIPVEVLDSTEVGGLIENHDVVLSF